MHSKSVYFESTLLAGVSETFIKTTMRFFNSQSPIFFFFFPFLLICKDNLIFIFMKMKVLSYDIFIKKAFMQLVCKIKSNFITRNTFYIYILLRDSNLNLHDRNFKKRSFIVFIINQTTFSFSCTSLNLQLFYLQEGNFITRNL